MQKTVVLNVVGLTDRLIGSNTPFLKQWRQQGKATHIEPVIPAVTCSAQSTYLTGKWPTEHGIVGNGWYFREEKEIKFWRQPNTLVHAPKIWEIARKKDPNFTCANMFWWYNMYSTVDYSVTPRPMYPSDGRKIPDVYTHPGHLREDLQKLYGQFPLFQFWGPRATIKSTQWIADASKYVEDLYNPTLTLIYLPHLDYNLQRYGSHDERVNKDLREIDDVCKDLIEYYEGKGANIIVLSEYGITPVDQPIHINRKLRENGYITVREELGREYLDAGASQAFAVADHQIAHVYVHNPDNIPTVKKLLQELPGIDLILEGDEKKQYHLDHERSGELVVLAKENAWFTYYFWLDDQKAPDFARTVEIHRKPGYDPVEIFTDPNIKLLPLKVAFKLAKKKLGFRQLMDIIPLDATLVKGAHGAKPQSREDWPVFMSKNQKLVPSETIEGPQVHQLMMQHLENNKS